MGLLQNPMLPGSPSVTSDSESFCPDQRELDHEDCSRPLGHRLLEPERSAVILTVIASAHRRDLDVWAYLRNILERLAKGETALEQLLPDAWKATHPQQVRMFREDEREQRAENRRYQAAKRRLETLQS